MFLPGGLRGGGNCFRNTFVYKISARGLFLRKNTLEGGISRQNQEFCQGGHGGGGNCSRNIFVFKTVK